MPPRTEGVAAVVAKAVAPEDFCDVWTPADQAKPFVWPPLEAVAPADAGKWRWVDVWATWCGPCLAEMPMIEKWQTRLAGEGVSYDFQLLSVDAEALDLKKHYAKQPTFRATSHIASGDAIAPWFAAIGVPEGTAIPLSLFIDPAGRLRCERAGALSEDDYATVKALLNAP